MPVDLEKMKQEMAAAPASHGREDFEFAQYNKLKIDYGYPSQPATKQLKLFSWPPQGGAIAQRVRIHFGLGTSGKGSVVCPKQHGEDLPCPVCDITAKVAQEGNELQRQAALKLAVKERFWVLCIDISKFKTTGVKEIAVWNASPFNHIQLMTQMQAEWGDFTALPESWMVVLSAYRDGKSPAGHVNVSGSPEKVQINLPDWLGCFPDLIKVLQAPPAGMIAAMLKKSPNVPQGIAVGAPRQGSVLTPPSTQPLQFPAQPAAGISFAPVAPQPAVVAVAPNPVAPVQVMAVPTQPAPAVAVSGFVITPPATPAGIPIATPITQPVAAVAQPAVIPQAEPRKHKTLDEILGRK